MSLTTIGKNAALNGITATTFTMSLHTGAPGDLGANLEAPSSNGYTREVITLAAADEGSRALTATPLFNVAIGEYSHYGIWADANCVDAGALDSVKNLTEAGQISITAGSISLT